MGNARVNFNYKIVDVVPVIGFFVYIILMNHNFVSAGVLTLSISCFIRLLLNLISHICRKRIKIKNFVSDVFLLFFCVSGLIIFLRLT